ncbi:MAG TPA: dihydroorotase [Leptospiraceae bacterium]|nr:dihydroorotase [Leptospiraceae bacterium]
MSNETNTIRIPMPDDWHLHLRDGDVLPVTVNHAASRCRRAIVMPNLKPPIRTVEEAAGYRSRIREVCKFEHFQPLMTLYLTDNTSPADIQAAKDSDFVFAVKLYPAGATTNSEDGLTSVKKAESTLARMEELDFPLLVHAESTSPDIDVFDREKAFIDGDLSWICNRFKKLRIVFEHVSSKDGVDFVESQGKRMGATVTPHHLLLTRNDLLVGGLKPHHYCLPVVKTEEDRTALLNACLKHDNVFAGTDSAPHPRSRKESHSCAAGIYTAPFFPELYAMAFERFFSNSGRDLKDLETFLRDFLCLRGERFYGLPLNDKQGIDTGIWLELQKVKTKNPESYPFGADELVPLFAGKDLDYKAEIKMADI